MRRPAVLSNERPLGLDIELLDLALAALPMQSQWIELPPARELRELEEGRIDGLPGRAATNQPAWVKASAGYRMARNLLYFRSGDARQYPMRDVEDLRRWRKLSLAITRGTAPPGLDVLLTEPAFRPRVVETTGLESSLRMLAAGHVTAVACGELAGLSMAQALGFTGRFEAHPMPLYIGHAHVLFDARRIDPVLVQAFDAAVLRLHRQGRVDALARTHGVPAEALRMHE